MAITMHAGGVDALLSSRMPSVRGVPGLGLCRGWAYVGVGPMSRLALCQGLALLCSRMPSIRGVSGLNLCQGWAYVGVWPVSGFGLRRGLAYVGVWPVGIEPHTAWEEQLCGCAHIQLNCSRRAVRQPLEKASELSVCGVCRDSGFRGVGSASTPLGLRFQVAGACHRLAVWYSHEVVWWFIDVGIEHLQSLHTLHGV